MIAIISRVDVQEMEVEHQDIQPSRDTCPISNVGQGTEGCPVAIFVLLCHAVCALRMMHKWKLMHEVGLEPFKVFHLR